MPKLMNAFLEINKNKEIKGLYDKILDCVIVIDKRYIIQHVNKETLNLLEYNKQQIIGKRLDFILSDQYSSRWDDFRRFLGNWPLRNHDVSLKKRYGVEIPVKMNFTPLSDNKAKVRGWFITAKDMSSTRDLIRELAGSRKELQETVKELEQSRDELVQSEKLSFAGRVAASIAHEIRNPLNIVSMAVQQLHSEFSKKDRRREYTKMVTDHIDRVDRLITEFVSVARPPRLKIRWKDVNSILDEVLKSTKPKIKDRKAKVTKDLDTSLPKLNLDEEHMTQALMNILLNAIDALPKRNGKIYISSEKEGNYAVIKIRNTGKPIPERDIIRIFDPFFSTKKGGTGLGMSIAYGVIGSHKGTITVESNKKIGTIFTIRFPIPS